MRMAAPAVEGDTDARLDCNRSNVTAIGDQLEQRGLVMRCPVPTGG
jgi:DNA-binding MarR family transcriptional regulator